MRTAQSKLKKPSNNSAILFSPKQIDLKSFLLFNLREVCFKAPLPPECRAVGGALHLEPFLEKLALYFTTERVLTFNKLLCLRQAGAERSTVLPQDTLASV